MQSRFWTSHPPERVIFITSASISDDARSRFTSSVIGKVLTNIPQSKGPQNGVRNGMEEHIGIAVAKELAIMGYINTT